jgi:hypothetical protein
MRGLDPRIHVFVRFQGVDGRDKPGDDEFNLIGKCSNPPSIAASAAQRAIVIRSRSL